MYGSTFGGGQQQQQQYEQFTDAHDTEFPLPPNTNEPVSCLKFAPLN